MKKGHSLNIKKVEVSPPKGFLKYNSKGRVGHKKTGTVDIHNPIFVNLEAF
jgi:hypothetical protein